MDMPLGEYLARHVPDQPAEPPWEGMSPREQAQWLMTEAANVPSLEEKDLYALRAITYLLMSIDDRLGAVQASPTTPAGPGSTYTPAWQEVLNGITALGAAVSAEDTDGTYDDDRFTEIPARDWQIGDRARTPGGNVGEITRIAVGPAGTFADLRTDAGHQMHIKIEALMPVSKAEPELSGLPDDVLDALTGAVEALRRGARVAYGPDDTQALLTHAQICTDVLEAHGVTERPIGHLAGRQWHIDGTPMPSVIGAHNAAVALRLAAEALEYIAPKSGVGDRSMLRHRAETCRRALRSNSTE